MADEEWGSKPKKLKFVNKYVIGFVLVFALGAAAEHYLLEPILQEQLLSDLNQAKNDLALLNEENSTCLSEKEAATGYHEGCITQVRTCEQDQAALQQELNNCQLE
jgi:hypothetical protein